MHSELVSSLDVSSQRNSTSHILDKCGYGLVTF